MDAAQPMSPRARLQELLAIPESKRTDAQWDEIHELEIKLSAANREPTPEHVARRNSAVTAAVHPKPSGGAQDRQSFKKFHKRRPKQSLP